MIWFYILGLPVIIVYQKIFPFLDSHVLLSPLKFKPSLGIWWKCRFWFRSGTWKSASLTHAQCCWRCYPWVTLWDTLPGSQQQSGHSHPRADSFTQWQFWSPERSLNIFASACCVLPNIEPSIKLGFLFTCCEDSVDSCNMYTIMQWFSWCL